jgi:hypothetical protein
MSDMAEAGLLLYVIKYVMIYAAYLTCTALSCYYNSVKQPVGTMNDVVWTTVVGWLVFPTFRILISSEMRDEAASGKYLQ